MDDCLSTCTLSHGGEHHSNYCLHYACFSEVQALSVVEHIDAAIGMSTSISDEAARIFAAQLYSSIGFGHSLQNSFDQAIAQLMLEGIPEENTPKLYVKDCIDSNDIILVKSE